MIPILYSSSETHFETNGIGRLKDAISCLVTEERNGEFELEMEYPITGKYFNQLRVSNIISAVPSDGKEPEPFRIYKISKPLNGVCNIFAEHISYQLASIPVMPFTANSFAEALQGLVDNAAQNCPFTVSTRKTTTVGLSSCKGV